MKLQNLVIFPLYCSTIRETLLVSTWFRFDLSENGIASAFFEKALKQEDFAEQIRPGKRNVIAQDFSGSRIPMFLCNEGNKNNCVLTTVSKLKNLKWPRMRIPQNNAIKKFLLSLQEDEFVLMVYK